MKLSDKEIDQLFKNNLTDLNLGFDSTNWDKLESRLKKKKKRKIIWLFFLSGISILSCIYLVTKYYKAPKPNLQLVEIKNITNEYSNKKSIQNLQIKEVVLSSEKNSKNSISINITPSNHILNSQKREDKVKNSNSTLLKIDYSKTKTTDKNLFLNHQTQEQNPKNEKYLVSKPDSIKNYLDSLLKNRNMLENNTIDIVKPKKITLIPITNKLKIDTKEKIKKNKLGFEIYPNISYYWIATSQKSSTTESRKQGKNIDFGINYTYYNNQKIDLIAGLYYSRISFEKTSIEQKPLETAGIVNPIEVDVKTKENNTTHFVKLRLDFNYYLHKNKWQTYFSLAPSLNLSLKGKITQSVEDEVKKINNKTPLISPSFNLGFGFERQFTKKVKLYFQPNIEVFIPSRFYFSNKEYIQSYSFGIKFGIKM